MSISHAPDTAPIIDQSDLDSLAKEFDGSGVVFIAVPWRELDACSEDPEGDVAGPLPSTLVVSYKRYGRIYDEPVCGRMCASRKIRDLVRSVARPDFIHVHVLVQRAGVAA